MMWVPSAGEDERPATATSRTVRSWASKEYLLLGRSDSREKKLLMKVSLAGFSIARAISQRVVCHMNTDVRQTMNRPRPPKQEGTESSHDFHGPTTASYVLRRRLLYYTSKDNY